MAKYKFVGFQEHVEIPEGFEKLEISSELSFSVTDVYEYLINPELLSKWFYPIKLLDVKPSGKVEFKDSNIEAICVAVDLGRNITLLSDQFGEFSAQVNDGKLILTFKILTSSVAEKSAEFNSKISTLKELIA